MARSLLSFTLALGAATLIGAVAIPASAQPKAPETSAAAPAQKKYPEAQEALDLLGKRNYPAALDKLKIASRKYPELPSEHVLMHSIFAQLNQANLARNELEQAVKETPSDPEPYVILGNIALQERRLAEAALDFDKAKQLLTSYTNEKRKSAIEQQTKSGIALLAESRQDWKAAEALLRELLTLAPEDLVAQQHLARALFWEGEAKPAYVVLKAAKKIDVANAAKNKTREVFLTPEAIMAQYYEQFEAGVDPPTKNPEIWFNAALKKAPDDLPTRQVVAIWALEKGKLDFAKEQAEAVLKIEAADAALPVGQQKYKGSNVGRMLRGLVALWQKDWADAEHYFEKVIIDSPNDFVARNNMALALCEQDDAVKKQRALDYALGNYNANKNNPDALSTLGWVYFRLGKFDQARLAIEGAVKATNGNISNADTATYLAYILYHLGQKYQAKEILESVLKSKKPFSMRPEAEKKYAEVKDEKPTETTTPAVTPTIKP